MEVIMLAMTLPYISRSRCLLPVVVGRICGSTIQTLFLLARYFMRSRFKDDGETSTTPRLDVRHVMAHPMALTRLSGCPIGIVRVWLYEERYTAGSLGYRALYRLVHTFVQA
jgi:hypothetical protein